MPGFAWTAWCYALDEFPELQKSYKHNIELVVDRLALAAEMRSRLSQSVEQALDLGQGVIEVLDADSDEVKTFSQRYACVDHLMSIFQSWSRDYLVLTRRKELVLYVQVWVRGWRLIQNWSLITI